MDTTAAAVLTPHVLRAGMMSRWTHSTNVISAIRGYTGISSSFIATNVTTDVVDDQLGASEFLTADHRPEVYNMLQQQQAERQSGEPEFKRCVRIYKKMFKPDDDKVEDCLMGGTMIFAEDAYSIHDEIFNRDSNANMDDNANEDHDKHCIDLLSSKPR